MLGSSYTSRSVTVIIVVRLCKASDWYRALIGLATLAIAPGIPASGLGAVVVDPSITLTQESVLVSPHGRTHYAYLLTTGTELVFTLRFSRWGGEPLSVWLVDEPNYRRLSVGRAFSYYEQGSGLARRTAQLVFAVPRTGVYYVVLDNPAESPRELAVYAYVNTSEPSAEDELTRRVYEGFYAELATLFELEEIDIVITRCGRVNAFSTPNRVVICKEFDEIMAAGPTPGLRLFVLMHETAHCFLYSWGYRSIYANQVLADRLAATLIELMDQEELAAHAARWFASNTSFTEGPLAQGALTIHRQRARRLAEWLNDDEQIDLLWTRRIVVPRMRSSALEAVMNRPGLEPGTRERIERELTRRLGENGVVNRP